MWNGLGLVFSINQDVKFHRYIFRLCAKNPNSVPLTILSGNNSLVAAEYLTVLEKEPDNVYVNFITGLVFIHLGSKKHISRRHDVCLQGLAFLSRYEELRGGCQETFYNLGRAMHQMNVLPAAIYYYNKVLSMKQPADLLSLDAVTGQKSVRPNACNESYDLRSHAAYNLALIYRTSGNHDMARHLLTQYCTV